MVNSLEKVIERSLTHYTLNLSVPYTDEKDIFDSDFGSTDEGSAPEDEEAGEKRLETEARRERRVSLVFLTTHTIELIR